MRMLDQVLAAYQFPPEVSVTAFGSGLINRTWMVSTEKGNYILQRINEQVFPQPGLIAANIDMVGGYLTEYYPATVFPRPVQTQTGETLVDAGAGGPFRLYPFIENSVTLDVADTPSQAFEAARQFGAFTRMLSGFPADLLHKTLPGFHDLSLRYRSFRESLQHGHPGRIRKAGSLIGYLESQNHIVTEYESILANPEFRRRVTHHDTKISNVLFDRQGKGICVIDLDTIMPGYFISDVGDMLRTYLSPVSEEEQDISLIEVRESYFQAIVEGYLQEMREELTETEKGAFVYAGSFMMYMQALRFLTDYLYEDVYYGRKYENHNYVRALNQSTLLRQFQDKAVKLKNITLRVAKNMRAGA
jgi:Ser/Thr protein kinase RdoA (MazF antagonist)